MVKYVQKTKEFIRRLRVLAIVLAVIAFCIVCDKNNSTYT